MLRYRDLRDGDNGPGKPFLLCTGRCGGEHSADRGDYWLVPPSTPIKCCGEPMVRVTRQTRLVAS